MTGKDEIELHKFARDEGLKYRTVYMWYWSGLVCTVGRQRALIRIPCRKEGLDLIAKRSDIEAFLRITGKSTPHRDTQRIILTMQNMNMF